LKRCALLIACLLVITASSALADPPPPAAVQTRQTMNQIFEAIRVLIPLSLDPERSHDPARREEVLRALGALAQNAEELGRHGLRRDAGFSYLSRSLAHDAREIYRRYQAQEFREADFLLHQIIDTCVTCHSRLPNERSFPLGAKLLEDVQVKALPLPERARLQMATRQFPAALASYEELFAAKASQPAELDVLGNFEDYLELCLRVEEAPTRARRTLQRFSERSDLSPELRAQVRRWLESLAEIAAQPLGESELARAREFLRRADDRERFPQEREALVYYVAASSMLHRYVARAEATDRDLAEASYLLGVIEARIGRTPPLSQAEVFLERAVRLAPQEPFARSALELLQELVVSGYAEEEEIPSDLRKNLSELRQLVEKAQPPSP